MTFDQQHWTNPHLTDEDVVLAYCVHKMKHDHPDKEMLAQYLVLRKTGTCVNNILREGMKRMLLIKPPNCDCIHLNPAKFPVVSLNQED